MGFLGAHSAVARGQGLSAQQLSEATAGKPGKTGEKGL